MKYVCLSWKALTLGVLIWLMVLCLRLCGRVRVFGIENIRNTPSKNRLIVSNHPSYLDPVLIPATAFGLQALLPERHHLLWQTPKDIIYHLFSFVREYPSVIIKTDANGRSNDPYALRKIMRILPDATITFFPEGSRTFFSDEPRSATASEIPLGKARSGVGFIVYKMKPTVIPALLRHTDRIIHPHEEIKTPANMLKILLRLFRYRIDIIYGKPLDLSRLWAKDALLTKALRAEISQKIMKEIAALDAPFARN